MIRMKPEEAMRAGLIDPLLAEELKKAGGPADVASAATPRKTSRRKSPAPAAPLVDDGSLPGDGRLVIDPMGIVQQAFLDFQIMPVPKERPRVVKNPKTGKVQTFTPQRTAAFHAQIHEVLKEVMKGQNLMAGPLRIDMTFKMPVAKSWPKWRQQAAIEGIIRPTGRPDMDNLEKALLDAFNGYIIEDDALVIERFARKIYAEQPGIEAKIDKLLAGDIHITRRQADLIRKVSGISEE